MLALTRSRLRPCAGQQLATVYNAASRVLAAESTLATPVTPLPTRSFCASWRITAYQQPSLSTVHRSNSSSIIPRPSYHHAAIRFASTSNGSAHLFSPNEKAVLKILQSIPQPAQTQSQSQSTPPSPASASASSSSPAVPESTPQDIVFTGHVRRIHERGGVVSIVLPLDQHYRTLKQQIIQRVKAEKLPWLKDVRVSMEAFDPKTRRQGSAAHSPSRTAIPEGLRHVKHIIAVSSCKGGVGKSTVAVNLAYALQQIQTPVDPTAADPTNTRDLRIGLLDADVYGPSLPTMISPPDTTLRYNEEKRIVPPIYEGVKTMSYGYVRAAQREQQAAASAKGHGSTSTTSTTADAASSGAFIRGPLASAVVKQLAGDTAWGELDYLIVDLPPGTGDIQLTLTQYLRFHAAVVVTTPQKLSLVDVAKGLEMFRKVSVPVVALVENMSFFTCDACTTKHRLFGEKGMQYREEIIQNFGQMKVVEIPILKQLAEASDGGDPFVLSHEPATAPVRDLYADLATSIHHTLSQGSTDSHAIPTLTYDASTGMMTLNEPTATPSTSSNAPIRLSARSLRLSCRCAGCIDELSGESRIRPDRIPSDVHPIGMQPRGNYAVAIHWSDGHASSIYPFEHIRQLVQEQQTRPEQHQASHQ